MEGFSSRRGEYDNGAVFANSLAKGLAPGFWLHEHARSPAIGGVVHGLVSIVSEVPEVVSLKRDQSRLLGLAQKRDLQNIKELGENADCVNLHLAQLTLQTGLREE